MNYYEHTLIARQNLSQKDVEEVEKKYTTLINENSGKVLKVEKWGLLNFKRKIKNYTKGYYLHYKMEGDSKTLEEIKNKTKLDNNIVRYLTVRYKKLDLKTEYFTKNKS
jgi:small subunit ribosomal protein S6|tara:strand:- start:4857 stop:5183 length:327 start_codon:yes stop_codon:yes gene_type:complete